jgi:hypothetical protein
MATLTGSKVKETYQSLLKLETGTASSTYKTVEDGQGNDTGLKISTTGIEVSALKFTADPSSSSSELTALVYDGSTKTVKVRDLSSSAFSGGLSSAILVGRVSTDFTIETNYSEPTLASVDNGNADNSYQFGPTSDLDLSPDDGTITVNTAGVYRVNLSAHTATTNSNTTITFKLLKDATSLLEIERPKAAAGSYMDSFEYVEYFESGMVIKMSYQSSGSGASLKAKSIFELERIE